METPNWPKLIGDIQERGYSLQEIAAQCGFSSRGALHDLKSGKQETCTYERGVRLVALGKKVEKMPKRNVALKMA